MKRYLLLLFVFSLVFVTFAQDKCTGNWKHIQEQKRAYFVQKMELTEAEQAAFIALYDEYEADFWAAKKKLKAVCKGVPEEENAADYADYIDALIAFENAQRTLRVSLLNDMMKIMPVQKVYKFCQAEAEFFKRMVKDGEKKCPMMPKK